MAKTMVSGAVWIIGHSPLSLKYSPQNFPFQIEARVMRSGQDVMMVNRIRSKPPVSNTLYRLKTSRQQRYLKSTTFGMEIDYLEEGTVSTPRFPQFRSSMDFWNRARNFAEEAAKKSQELRQTIAAANLSDVVSEASKRSKELAAEALKRADQITAHIPPAAAAITNLVDSAAPKPAIDAADLDKYGITDELREFVKEITINTFQDFPLEDDSEMSDIPTVSNVQQDLTEWQERHAKLVLLTVKEVSKLRYQLCPREMKERKFWRIYFILVNNHVAPYEQRYMDDLKNKTAEKVNITEVKEVLSGETSSKTVDEVTKPKSNDTKPKASEQDLDAFLLGDLEDGDDGPGLPLVAVPVPIVACACNAFGIIRQANSASQHEIFIFSSHVVHGFLAISRGQSSGMPFLKLFVL
ncbi:hypothetical protein C2S52_021809 [Perilla frutescens var. hirtella]|nr:hypothetical protein C2S52_021809 [Perilla frutescens var. hirtella]